MISNGSTAHKDEIFHVTSTRRVSPELPIICKTNKKSNHARREAQVFTWNEDTRGYTCAVTAHARTSSKTDVHSRALNKSTELFRGIASSRNNKPLRISQRAKSKSFAFWSIMRR